MADIVLAALNSRYSHTAFGLRYLLANMEELQPRTAMLEYEIKTPLDQVIEGIAAHSPRIVGLSVYIWNANLALTLVKRLRKELPGVKIVLGGPEVSHEVEKQEICALADFVVMNEGDFVFPILCRQLLAGETPPQRVINGGSVDVRKLKLPYYLYTDEDIAHRVIYVEASRGCPFDCEFCLFSLNIPVRRFPLESILPAFQELLDRGVRHFKFMDRTFNLSIKYGIDILSFFLERYTPGLFLHFEMVPDRLPEELKDILSCFPKGSMQLEVGIQTFNEEVAERIKRRQDYAITAENILWLRSETGAYLHADLIAGLPGENLESFAHGFDRLLALGPQEIQLNILKRLRGTPIIRHDEQFGMKYNSKPPYDLIENRDIDAETVAALNRVSRFWDLYVNSGNYIETAPLIWKNAKSPFYAFHRFCEWIYKRWERTHAISIDDSAEALFLWLTDELGEPREETAQILWKDLCRTVSRNRPTFLRDYVSLEEMRHRRAKHLKGLQRQARHTDV